MPRRLLVKYCCECWALCILSGVHGRKRTLLGFICCYGDDDNDDEDNGDVNYDGNDVANYTTMLIIMSSRSIITITSQSGISVSYYRNCNRVR